jgi:hypothetical protein
MREKLWQLFLVGTFFFNSSILCFAGMESENYRIPRSVQSGGGSFMASENYAAGATLGQTSAIGLSLSAGYGVQAGFWISILTKGDVNGDGKVDLADLVLSLQVLTGMSASDVHRGADVNGDGHIGLAEAIFILGKAAGLRD